MADAVNTSGTEGSQNDTTASGQDTVIEVHKKKPVVSKKTSTTGQTKAGLIFSTSRVHKHLKMFALKDQSISKADDKNASVYMAAVLEYLCAEVLDAAGTSAKNNNRVRINPRDIMFSFRHDKDFVDFLGHADEVVFSQAGVVPKLVVAGKTHEPLLKIEQDRRKGGAKKKKGIVPHESPVITTRKPRITLVTPSPDVPTAKNGKTVHFEQAQETGESESSEEEGDENLPAGRKETKKQKTNAKDPATGSQVSAASTKTLDLSSRENSAEPEGSPSGHRSPRPNVLIDRARHRQSLPYSRAESPENSSPRSIRSSGRKSVGPLRTAAGTGSRLGSSGRRSSTRSSSGREDNRASEAPASQPV